MTSEPRFSGRAWSFALAAALVLAACMAAAFFPLPADDAYIVARYAMHVAHGHGMVYNAGEQVNALTSPLHLGVLLVLQPLAGDFVTLYRAICAIAVPAVLLALAWRRWGRGATSAYFLSLTLASPFVAFWTVGGLETPMLLVVCTAIAFLALARDDSAAAAWVVALAAVAVLLRHDAVLFAGPVAVHAAWRHRQDARVLAAAVGGCAAVAAWLLFALLYFGDILPTSFYVKAGHAPGAGEIARGALYVASFLVLTWTWMMLFVPRRAAGKGSHALWIGLGLTFAYALFASTRHMMYGYRLLVPFLPALVLALLAARDVLPRRGGTAVACILGAQATLAAFVYFYSQNPSLSLLAEGRSDARERFEFSHVGARHTATFLALAPGQADAIRRHWAATGLASTRPPRIVVSTGGALPYLLPDAYVLEQLVSYRHDCKPALEPLADYAQVIYVADDAERIAQERVRQGRDLVARASLEADGLRTKPLSLVVETWYRPDPLPVPLPAKVRGPCR